MIRTIIKIDGMACGMCEAHINETLWKLYPQAKKATSSHKRGEARILTEEPPDAEALRGAINATGYSFVSCESSPREKKGLFG